MLRYLCTGREPRPTPDVQLGSATGDNDFILPPHDYGVAVILLALADRVVPAAQVERLRAGVRQYLWASALDGGVDKARAPAEFEAVRKLARTLPEPSATLLRYVNDRDVVHLGARLLPFVGASAAATGAVGRRSRRSRRRRSSCCTASRTTSSRRSSPSISPRICAATRRCGCC